MNFEIALLLGQDGISNGAIYALLALALVLAFAVTRVILIPQGEFVSYGALTLAALQAGRLPGTVWLLLIGGVLVALVDGAAALRARRWRGVPALLCWNIAYPLALLVLLRWVPLQTAPMLLQIALALAVVVPLGPMLYRLAFQPLAEASVLVLLILAVAVHVVMVGLGLLLFGAEGSRTPAFSDGRLEFAGMSIPAQTLWVVGCSLALIVILYLLFERTLYGKALRAAAINATGARLMGISAAMAGRIAFLLAAIIGAITGVLVSSVTMIYYDTGFLLGLKGFVAAIMGGLISYPLAAVGAIGLGVMESFAAYFASAFKEAIVFSLIIPILFWRSLATFRLTDDEE